MTLYLFEYNNYYNRIVKKLPTIQDYEREGRLLDTIYNVNFLPNDGISTEHIINYDATTGNYVIITDGPREEIVSRWFVLESVRIRVGQYKLTLYRDVVADWKDEIVNAPMFIEKAMCRIGDSAIFNNENMSYNQVKTSETLLKDKTKCPWIVGYVARDAMPTNPNLTFTLNTDVAGEYENLEDYPYYKYDEENPMYPSSSINNTRLAFNFKIDYGVVTNMITGIDLRGNPVKPLFAENLISPDTPETRWWKSKFKSSAGHRGYPVTHEESKWTPGLDKLFEEAKARTWNGFDYTDADFTNITGTSETTLNNEDGKIIHVGQKYYRVKVNRPAQVSLSATIPSNSNLGLQMRQVAESTRYDFVISGSSNAPLFCMELLVLPAYFTFEVISVDEMHFGYPDQTSRMNLNDAPYDMFAIPYGEMYVGDNVPNKLTSPDVSLKTARAIQLSLGQGIYDLQIVPYCPINKNIFSEVSDGRIKIQTNLLDTKDYTVVEGKANEYRSIAFWLTQSTFTKIIDYKIEVADTAIEFKVQNECDMYRLNSPNWNGAFEFSATKNNGVSGFRVDCSYKPFSPYIRVAPLFGGLYGEIVDDARGLICGGSFSMTQVTDAWITYQLQNANYQAMFDRQIENMEVNNSVQRVMEGVNAITGTIGGAVTGGMGGAMLGGGAYGAAAGAAIGGVTSMTGGIADIVLNEQLRTEALDYTKDQFGYQLGNIKALPQSLTKVSSFNANNKIFPVLEYYTCTDIEKEALRSKIRYNGMTVMRIGTINQFMQPTRSYIKGKLIRIENIADDFHVTNTIANELNKGVFI